MKKVPTSKPTQFKKGQSGNPAGRPKKIPILDVLLADVLGSEDKKGVTVAKKILDALSLRAMKGDVRAAEVLLERAWGKVKQPIGLTTENPIDVFLQMPLTEQAEYLKKLEKQHESESNQGPEEGPHD